MYTFTYDSQGSNSYLVYQLKDTDRIDSLSLGMITHNQIEGFLPTIFQQIDANQYLKYNISSRVSLRQFYSDTVNRKQLLGTISGITSALLRAEEYMINPDSLLLEMDYIFVDVSNCRAYMVCLPLTDMASRSGMDGKSADINEKMSLFLRDIIFRTQFDQSEDLGYVAQIISFMNRPQAFSLPDFKDFLQQLAGKPFGQQAATATYPSIGVPHAGVPQAGVPPAAAPQTAAPSAGVPSSGVPQASAPPAGARQAGVPPYGQMPPPSVAGVPTSPHTFTPPAQPGQRPQPAPQGATSAGAPFVPPVPPAQEKPSGKKKKKSSKKTAPSPAPAGGQDVAVPAGGEKKMSLMYLLSHYSKENKAIYNAQKQQKTATPQMAGAPSGPQVPFAVPGVKEGIPGSSQPYRPAPPKAEIPQRPPAPAPGPVPAGRKMPAPAPPPYPAPPPQAIKQEHAYPPVPPVQAPPMPPVAGQPHGPSAGPVSFGDTTSLSGGRMGETVVLDAAVVKEPVEWSPHLIRRSNQERIPLNKPLFRIGKEKSFVDYFIGDNTAISRSHAHIITRDGQFFVVDTNSTNRTFINGQMIPPNHEAVLNDGDTLTLANESFEFHLR